MGGTGYSRWRAGFSMWLLPQMWRVGQGVIWVSSRVEEWKKTDSTLGFPDGWLHTLESGDIGL